MRNEQEMIAYALEIDPQLLPFANELLADLEALGSDVELIVELLAGLELPDTATVLDLGCGKGAVSIVIAEQLGLQVTGIDLFQPFIDSCRQRTQASGVSHLCSFKQADILQSVDNIEPADVVIFAALGDVLGPLDDTIGIIRRFVKPNGFFIVCDDYLKPGKLASDAYPGFEGYVEHQQTLQRLTAHGDVIEQEIIESDAAMIEENAENNRLIRERVQQLADQYPELADAFFQFADDQEAECQYMEENLISAIWLLRRS